MNAINGLDADTNREIILKLVDLFDPWLRCAEPDCSRSVSFKAEWLTHVMGGDSLLDNAHNREEALDWWRDRQRLSWYCSQHDKVS